MTNSKFKYGTIHLGSPQNSAIQVDRAESYLENQLIDLKLT